MRADLQTCRNREAVMGVAWARKWLVDGTDPESLNNRQGTWLLASR